MMISTRDPRARDLYNAGIVVIDDSIIGDRHDV